MAAIDHKLSKARGEVTCWNLDRDWGFRGHKGYGIARNYYHRAARRFGNDLCNDASVDETTALATRRGEVFVHGVSDLSAW